MADKLSAAPELAVPPLVSPTAEEWRALTPAERERFLVRVLDALSDPRVAMSEGRPHKKAKTRALDRLGLYFSSIGKVVYLAEEMAVLYPGEPPFTPDLLAVLDVPEPEDDARMAWVVADEGKGLDLVIEVLHHGDRNKDLVQNVERYARLGIAEYFVYDRGHQQIHGFRLQAPGAGRYQRVLPQVGRYTSNVLRLDLAVLGGKLRFFVGDAELPGTADLIGRLQTMVEELSVKADRAAQAIEALRAGLLGLLGARGLAVTEEARDRVSRCDDPAVLQRWLLRAVSASSAAEALAVEVGTPEGSA
jgi:Uma2 family endonuclease